MDARQQPATAERFARAALDGGAGFDARIVLAEALQWAGRGDDAESELLAAVDAATTSEQVVRAHDLRADVLSGGSGWPTPRTHSRARRRWQ